MTIGAYRRPRPFGGMGKPFDESASAIISSRSPMRLYARHILVTLQAVHPRILALHAECQREAAAARNRRRGWQVVVWARRQGPNPEP
jgi:hypothetical protein